MTGTSADRPGKSIAARLRAFGAFWYDFVIGDDWLVAAGVVAALAGTYGLSQAGVTRVVAGPGRAGGAPAGQPEPGG